VSRVSAPVDRSWMDGAVAVGSASNFTPIGSAAAPRPSGRRCHRRPESTVAAIATAGRGLPVSGLETAEPLGLGCPSVGVHEAIASATVNTRARYLKV
jgi:hypothetical protein